MSQHHQLPQYRHWTAIAQEFGILYSILWLLGTTIMCWLWPRGGQYQLADLWLLTLPFLLPVIPALVLATAIWLLIRRRGYVTLWSGLAAGLRSVQTARLAPGATLPTTAAPTLILGQDDTGRSIQLDSTGLGRHFLVTGRTRQGKSTLLADVAQQDAARADCAVVVVDPHAGLVDVLLATGLDRRAGDRLVVLQADQDHVPGWNLLEPLPGETPVACATRLVETALALWFRGDVTEAQRVQEHTHHAAWALAETGWTVAEIVPLLRQRGFRQYITAQITDPDLQAWLTALDHERDDRLRDRTESTVNRWRAFTHGTTSLIFGQRRTSFDLLHLLNNHGILLAALPTAALGDTGAYLAAGTLLSLIDILLARRSKNSPAHTNPYVRLILDEVQAYAVVPLQHLLAERAGFGAALVLATQGLTQLADRRWSQTVLNNTNVRVVFAGSAAEAQLLAEEVFRPNPIQVKRRHDPWITFYSPTEQLAYWTKTIQHLPPHTFFAHAPGGDPVRGTTRPLPTRLNGKALAAVRADLARRVGRPRAEIEVELEQRRRWIYEGASAPTIAEDTDGWV